MKVIGKLVSIEGINYAGKTTQVGLLKKLLEQEGHEVSLFKFPNYRTEVGKLLHKIMYKKKAIPLHSTFALFSVNRLEHKHAIEESRMSKDVVLFDRYSESEYAYGGARGLPKSWLLALESQMPSADIVFVLDIAPQLALHRARSHDEKDVFERDLDFLTKVRQLYIELSSRPPCPNQRWIVIDAEQTVEAVNRIIKTELMKAL